MNLKEIWKRGITLQPLILPSTEICHSHLYIIEIMCGKFQLNDLKTVEEVLDTNLLNMDI